MISFMLQIHILMQIHVIIPFNLQIFFFKTQIHILIPLILQIHIIIQINSYNTNYPADPYFNTTDLANLSYGIVYFPNPYYGTHYLTYPYHSTTYLVSQCWRTFNIYICLSCFILKSSLCLTVCSLSQCVSLSACDDHYYMLIFKPFSLNFL